MALDFGGQDSHSPWIVSVVSRLSWSLTQAYLYLREFLVSYGTGNNLPTLFPKVAFGPSNSTFLLFFHTLTVSDTDSASPLIIELPFKGRIVIIKITRNTYLAITFAKLGLVSALKLIPIGRGYKVDGWPTANIVLKVYTLFFLSSSSLLRIMWCYS